MNTHRRWYAILYVQVLLAIVLGVAVGFVYPTFGTALKPHLADCCHVPGQHGNGKSAVAIEDRRIVAIERKVVARDLEVRYPHTILCNSVMQ